jgi:monoamine oxidase
MNSNGSHSQAVPDDESAKALWHAISGRSGPGDTGWTGSAGPAGAYGDGTQVLILGAGVAGLTAAYELSRSGYKVTVLEAQSRIGGRSRTARRGDELYELDGDGRIVRTHTCAFDDGLYLNLGPGRIPYHHRRVLAYCRDLDVKLEPYIMETTANRVRPPGAVVNWTNRQVANDTRGHLSARLAETLTSKDAFTGEVRDLLRVFGDLKHDKYEGSTRSGYLHQPDVEGWPQPAPPLTYDALIESGFWKARFYQPVDYLWQATMFQPVGGMDHIVKALARKAEEAGATVLLEAKVTGIAIGSSDLPVTVWHSGGVAQARYCISSIPLPVLKQMSGQGSLHGFSAPFLEAIGAVGFAKTCKVGWQANQRFWEGDLGGSSSTNDIYGGISWTAHNITQLWYPSNDYFTGKGTLTGAYNFGEQAEELGSRSPAGRLELAREGATELHPEFSDHTLVPDDKAVTIAWHKVPYQLGGWAAWDPAHPGHLRAYRQLLQPEGQGAFHVAGDQVSPLPGWQEGAMMSAHYVIHKIRGTMPLDAPEEVAVPDSVALTQGLY